MNEDFTKYDLVILDSVANDEIFNRYIGEQGYLDRVSYEIASIIASQTKLIILGFCLDLNFEVASEIYKARKRIAAACGAQFIGMRDLVLRFGEQMLGKGQKLFETNAHPRKALQREFGLEIGRALLHFQWDKPKASDGGQYRSNFHSSHAAALSDVVRVINRKNSLFEFDFLDLREGEALSLARPSRCLGFYLNKLNTKACLEASGPEGRRLKELWYTADVEKFEIRFIPFRNGCVLDRLTVTGPGERFERSAYTDIGGWRNPEGYLRAEIEKVAFWDGDSRAPLPEVDDAEKADVLHRIVEASLQEMVNRSSARISVPIAVSPDGETASGDAHRPTDAAIRGERAFSQEQSQKAERNNRLLAAARERAQISRAAHGAGSPPKPGVVFDDADLRVVFRPAASSSLLITFSNMLFRPNGDDFWARTMCEKAGLSALGFVAKSPNWFPLSAMLAASEALTPYLAAYTDRVAYGNSMGAYGALKYSGLLGASTIVAFCPQYSIDPAQVGHFDKRFIGHFRPDVHEGMEIRPENISGRPFLFYDPFEKPDLAHIERIAQACSEPRLLPAAMTGHNTIGLFAGTKIGSDMLRACIEDRPRDLAKAILVARRNHPMRTRYNAEAAVSRHPAWAQRILHRYSDRLRPEELAHCRFNMATQFRVKGDIPGSAREALACIEAVLTASPEERVRLRLNNLLHGCAGFLARAAMYEKAEEAERIAVRAEPQNLSYLKRFLELLWRVGKEEDALVVVDCIASLSFGTMPDLLAQMQKVRAGSHRLVNRIEQLLELGPSGPGLRSFADLSARLHGSEVPNAPTSELVQSVQVSDTAERQIRHAASLLRDGKIAEGEAALRGFSPEMSGPAALKLAFALLYRARGRSEEAERQLLAGLALDEKELGIRRVLANMYSETKRLPDAVGQFAAIAEITETSEDLQRLAQALLRNSQPEEAVAALQRALKKASPTATRYAMLGTALYRLARYDEAIRFFQLALALEPSRIDTQRECGLAYSRLGRPLEAVPYFQKVVDLTPGQARGYLDLSRAYATAGATSEAIDALINGLHAVGESVDLLIELARHRARGGDRLAAMDLFARALAIQPDHLTAALEYIRQAMTARKFGPAKEVADKLIAQHPEHPEVLFEFGRVCLETAQPERARESFEAALRHRPEMHQAHYRLSQISLRANDIPAAVEQMSRAVDLDPTRVSYRIDRARMYLALGQFDAARADAEAALAIEPRNLKANQIVSLVREMSDERPEARVAACFHATAAELPALQAALAMLPAPHEAWIVVSEGAAPEAGERVLRLGRDAVEPTLTEASEAPWMLVAPAAAAPAIVALLADPSTEAALRPLEKIYGRAVFIDAAGLPAMTVMRRELLHFFGDMAEIEGRPAHALLAEHEEMLRTVTIDPAGVVHRLPAPTLPREDGREKVFLISRHGYQLYGGGEQFLRGMATIYRGEGFEPVIIGMRSDTPAAVEGEEEGQRFAQLRPLPGDIFTYALKHRPRLVQVLSGLGYEVITPLKYLHVATVYGTHFWRDMFEEIGGYLNIDQTAVPKREFNAILQQATVVYSNSHYTAEMKRKHFGVSTPLVYSLTADTDAPPVTTGKYALLVNARPEKGFDLILEVAKRVPHVPFLVLASQSPVAQAQEAVERAGVKNITIAGKVSDMMEAYSRAKVVLVPSYAFIETFSRVVIEAHRLGVPVIGSDRGNVPYLMTESGTSLPEDADAWAAELDRLFTDRAYYDQRVKLALENSERYAFARQPERIRRIVGFTERRILVAVGAGLGNIVQTSPLIRRLAEHYGRPVDVVVKEDFKGCSVLVAGSPYVNMVFPLDRNVVQREYDMVYVTHSFGDIIPAFNSNTIVAARRHFVFQMTKDIHEAEFNLFCARELLGVPYEKADAAKYFVANASRSRLPNGIIGIHSGGKGGEWEAGSWLNKRWPYYKDLVKALQARGYKVASFGVQSEYVEGTIDLTGTPLMESVRNIAQCSYFIGNDSGLMHIADGLGVPLTTIFGPTSVVKNGPLAPTSSVIELKKDCAPCQFDERFATCTCIASVGLEPVLDHVLRHMAKAAGPEGEKAYKGLETLPVLVG
jgi:tetratricopeptide (TPR) repeat protein/ADP-heptose:LPS heptosyltransferase/glycosyltransferase involved in cell wall biosynthesis